MTDLSLRLEPSASPGRAGVIGLVAPGVALAAGVAGLAFGLRLLPGFSLFSPMILAVVIGLAVNSSVGRLEQAAPGLKFSLRRLLRFAIVLLGLQLTASQVAAVGVAGVLVLAVTLCATFVFTTWLGRVLGVDRRLTQLIAAGTSICGASAIVATNTVTRAPDEDVAYAVASVTLYGTLAMLLFPVVAGLLGMGPRAFGLWTGASVHEVAQVVAAAFQRGQESGQFGTMAKLTRVMFLAPVVIGLGLLARNRFFGAGSDAGAGEAKVPVPWFVLGFVAMVALNSVLPVPAEARGWIVTVTSFLLTMALAAVGLETNLKKLGAKGWRPLLLGFCAFLFIASCGLLLVGLIA